MNHKTAYYHLPGLFECYELYRVFLPLYRAHREYFYDWCDIGSLYGAPEDCLWGGGRIGSGSHAPPGGTGPDAGVRRLRSPDLQQFPAATGASGG